VNLGGDVREMIAGGEEWQGVLASGAAVDVIVDAVG
jgi:hypothetical protein